MALLRPLLPPIAALAGWLLSGGSASPASMLAIVAAAAAIVIAGERRTRAAGLAAGIAAALSPAGLAILPVLLGTAIARRSAVAGAAAFAIGLVATRALLPPTANPLRWTDAPGGGLLAATACGFAAWMAAICSARPPSRRELDQAALLASVALPLLVPIGVEAMGIAVALLLAGVRLSLAPIATGANDNPLPLRRVGFQTNGAAPSLAVRLE